VKAQIKAVLQSGQHLRLTAGLLLTVFAAGALLTWWAVIRADHELRAGQMQQARLVAQAVGGEDIKALTGTEADLHAPVYLRIKQQLAAIRLATPQCRFIYLVGRRMDGTLFFYVDSEPSDSKDCSPAGQIYTEAPAGFQRVFATRNATTEGPYTDRWGKWISALVPIFDPQTAVDGLATPEDARRMVLAAVDYYHQHGREQFLKEVNNPQGRFHRGDLYAFVYDRKMTFLAHPVKPELVGQNLINQKDWAGGTYFRREIQAVARNPGRGWVEFEYENFVSQQLDHKTTYVAGADDLIICAGAYKGDGKILSILGMDTATGVWNWKLAQAALPPGIMTLLLAGIVLFGSAQLARRARHPGPPGRWGRHLEPGLAAATGLVLTLFVGWMIRERDLHDRHAAFSQLAASQSEVFANTLHELRNSGLEGLAHLYEQSGTVTAQQFEQFTAYLTKNPAVLAWEWIPVVPAAERSRLEGEARAAGLTGFEIWERDAAGHRRPATAGAVCYPVLYVAPRAGNEPAQGFDLGSEPLRRAALETAAATGLPTATDPVPLVQGGDNQKGMLVFRPVFDREHPGRLRGFALIVLRMSSVLRSVTTDNSVLMELTLRREDGTSEPLATSWPADGSPPPALSLMRPVLAFGKAFSVTTYAGPEFMRLHTVRDGWLAGLTGLVATTALALLIGVLHRRREQLEQLVSDRTTELRASEQAHRDQFAQNSAVMLLLDPGNGMILDANTAAASFYGYCPAVLRTMRITNLDVQPASAVLSALATVRREQGCRFLSQHRLAGGGLRDVEVSASRIQFGPRIVLHLILYDVTERKRVEDSLRKFSQAIEQSPVSVVITNREGIIEFVNPKFCQVTGYTAGEVLGQTPRVLKSGLASPEEYRELWRTIAGGKEWLGEFLNKKKDGELFWESAHISPIRDASGKITHYLGIKEDITDRKRAEAALQTTNEQLEIATARANDMAVQSELANAAKSDFLANMSHEIRTPMNGVLGMLGLLEDTRLTEEQHHYTRVARASGVALLGLINDILDFSKIEARKLVLETLDFSLADLLDDLAEVMALRAQEKGLVLGCVAAPGVPLELRGDAGRLRQILINLAGNAIKFTPAGEVVIRVRLVAETPAGAELHFSVSDTGIGISKDQAGRLFAKFTQADSSTTRLYGGTGLGLAISKQLVELMGGEIGVRSQPDRGSEFWFTVRLAKAAAPTLETGAPAAELGRVRILVVDDHAIYREMALALLHSLGMRPAAATDAASALQALMQAQATGDPFRVAVLDSKLHDMDGTSLAGTIKGHPLLKATRLLMSTSLGQRVSPQRMEEAGFMAALRKPVRRQKLLEVLLQVLGGQAVGEPRPDVPLTFAPNPGARPARILLTEDNPTNQQVALGILKKLGLSATVAANGAEAVRALEARPYDLVLMDVQMPEMDGLQATRIIRDERSRVHNHQVPIVAMTAHALPGDREQCQEAGMNDYVTKPIEVRALVAALEKWLPSHTETAPPPAERTAEPVAPARREAEPAVFNRRAFMQRMMNDEQLAHMIIETFLGDMPAQIKQLKSHVLARETQRIGRQAHKIKGASSNVGGEALSASAAALEQAAKTGDPAQIAARTAELDAQLEALMEALRNELAPHN